MEDTSENRADKSDKKPLKHVSMGLLAHVDAGKTTLSEAILYQTGTIRKMGRVDNQDAFLDTYELEKTRGITIFSKQAVFVLGEQSVTLLDTPGHVDFSAEMERTLGILDYGVLVISGTDGVQSHTETLWQLLKRYQVPVFLFVNKMDLAGTDRQRLLKELKERLHENIVPFDKEGMRGQKVWREEIAICDEAVLERYLERGDIEKEEIGGLIARRRLFPCCFGSALKRQGIQELLQVLELYGGALTEESVRSAAGRLKGAGTCSARIFKISRDEQGNRLTHLKVTGGCLRVKDMLPAGEAGEKVNQIRIYNGARYETVSQAEAGCVCAVTGPVSTFAGQVLGEEKEGEQPVLEPILTYRLILPEGSDIHSTLIKLRQLEEEEPQLHLIWNEALGELQAQIMGEVQTEILQSMIRERFGLSVEFGAGNIVYKETIRKPVEGVGHFEPLRHYAEVHLLLEPGERGSGLQFGTSCSEDVLDRNWQRLILTHLEEKRHIGVLTGSEITDMRITLTTGRAHIKHTEGGDFRQAVYRAVRQGLMEAECCLLEPYYQFRLKIPSEALGRALTDLERMKGSFEPPKPKGDMMVLMGSAPAAAMRGYQIEVASYTRGRGMLSCGFKGYEPCHNAEEVIASLGYDPEKDLENPSGSIFCAHGAGYQVSWDQVKRHMHVESTLETESLLESDSGKEKKEAFGERKGRAGQKAAGRGALPAWGAKEKELEEIFLRTYGYRGKKAEKSAEARKVSCEPAKTIQAMGGGREEEEEEEYLLVDGYNIIFAWEELRELAEITVDGARQKLMDILCNYQGYKKCILILVFDAYKVEGNLGQALRYHNIHVVYTKEAETADQYIEKLAHQMGRTRRVTVATSDGLEQLIIRGQGCRLLSARDFREEIEYVNQQIQKDSQSRGSGTGSRYLFDDAPEELARHLEKVRLGKEEMHHGRETDKKRCKKN